MGNTTEHFSLSLWAFISLSIEFTVTRSILFPHQLHLLLPLFNMSVRCKYKPCFDVFSIQPSPQKTEHIWNGWFLSLLLLLLLIENCDKRCNLCTFNWLSTFTQQLLDTNHGKMSFHTMSNKSCKIPFADTEYVFVYTYSLVCDGEVRCFPCSTNQSCARASGSSWLPAIHCSKLSFLHPLHDLPLQHESLTFQSCFAQASARIKLISWTPLEKQTPSGVSLPYQKHHHKGPLQALLSCCLSFAEVPKLLPDL